MLGNLSILFYPKKKHSDTDGLVTIYARLTVDGERSEFSLKKGRGKAMGFDEREITRH